MHKTNPSQDRLKTLFNYDPDTGLFKRKITCGGQIPGVIAGRVGTRGYIYISVDGGRYSAHRLAWIYIYGFIDNKCQIDHINRITGDNRIANLRLVAHKQNMENVGKKKWNTSGHIGIDFRFGKWRARIQHNKKMIHIGMFDDINHAIKAREIYQSRLHTHAII